MNFHVLKITNSESKSNPCPGIWFCSSRLSDMGFIPSALVQVLPETDGMVFVLCNENIKSYSELDTATKERHGKLVQMCYATINEAQTPLLSVQGRQLFHDAGLSIGDYVALRCVYGLIHIRKLPDTSRIIYMTSIKERHTGNRVPKLRLTGEWLNGFGFVPDSLLTAAFKNGSATFELRDEGVDKYRDLVRYARQNRLKILQVKSVPANTKTVSTDGKVYPYISLTGYCIDKMGLEIGDILLAACKHGLIKLQKLGLADLGF